MCEFGTSLLEDTYDEACLFLALAMKLRNLTETG